MIGRLTGTLRAIDETLVLIDVAGVGYEVEITAAMLAALPPAGQPLELCTHLVIREDAHHLFGFVNVAERELFRTLIRVTGVGPRMAMGLLSGMRAAEFAQCVADSDIARLIRLPGVGRKTAERLVVELRDRMPPMLSMGRAEAGDTSVERGGETAAGTRHAIVEAEGALIALGYRPVEASRAVSGAWRDGISVEELVRGALRGMVAAES